VELLLNLKARKPGQADVLTAGDIKQCIEEWVNAPVTLVPAMPVVYLDGKTLEGASVIFDPEPFLGPSYHRHQATANAAGMADLDPELPAYPHCLYVGLYRVRISKIVDGKESIPAKYNTQTTLGRELSSNCRDSRENLMFRLKSK
jgi:hypothetical protein